MELSNEAKKLLLEIFMHRNEIGTCDVQYWHMRFSNLSVIEVEILKSQFIELVELEIISVLWLHNMPHYLSILKKGIEYIKNKGGLEFEAEKLIQASRTIENNQSSSFHRWISDVKIFSAKVPNECPLKEDFEDAYFRRNSKPNTKEIIIGLLESFQNWFLSDSIETIMEEKSMNNVQKKLKKEFDVFLSHANSDKEKYVDDLYNSINKLGINIFYDKNVLEWGDNWKDKILSGTNESEFAIIVISQNFFGREWTEKELHEFLNRQDISGEKIVLPLLYNISIKDFESQYPNLGEIQALESHKFSTDEIAIQLARQLIKRYKNE